MPHNNTFSVSRMSSLSDFADRLREMAQEVLTEIGMGQKETFYKHALKDQLVACYGSKNVESEIPLLRLRSPMSAARENRRIHPSREDIMVYLEDEQFWVILELKARKDRLDAKDWEQLSGYMKAMNGIEGFDAPHGFLILFPESMRSPQIEHIDGSDLSDECCNIL